MVETPDFSLQLSASQQTWTVMAFVCLCDAAVQYNVSPSMHLEFNKELESWTKKDSSVPYNKHQHRMVQELALLMAVPQYKTSKVQPIHVQTPSHTTVTCVPISCANGVMIE